MSNKKSIIRVIALVTAALILACMLLMFTGCAETYGYESYSRFRTVEKTTMDEFTVYLVVDTKTGVLYLRETGKISSGLTVLVDAEGKPLLWEDYAK